MLHGTDIPVLDFTKIDTIILLWIFVNIQASINIIVILTSDLLCSPCELYAEVNITLRHTMFDPVSDQMLK